METISRDSVMTSMTDQPEKRFRLYLEVSQVLGRQRSRGQVVNVCPELLGTKLDWMGGSNTWKYLQRVTSLTETNAAWLNIWTSPPPPSLDSGSYTDLFGTNAMQFYQIKAVRP
jgi:hypothetical protein